MTHEDFIMLIENGDNKLQLYPVPAGAVLRED